MTKIAAKPEDLMFQVTGEGSENLRCQIGISNSSGVASTRGTLRSQIVTSAEGMISTHHEL